MTAGNKKFSDLSPAGTLDGSETVCIVKNGSTVRTTTSAIAGSVPATAGSFTTLIADSIDSTPVGSLTPDTGDFTVLSTTGLATLDSATVTNTLTPTGGIAAGGGFVASPRVVHSGNVTATQTSDGNDTTPSITETYFCEIFVPCNMPVTGIANFNGSAVGTDKWMFILWNSSGTPIASTDVAGTTAVGTDTFQKIALTGPITVKGPATYFVGLQCNGTTARFNTHILGGFGAAKLTATTFGTSPSITPPTTFTTALGPIMSLY